MTAAEQSRIGECEPGAVLTASVILGARRQYAVTLRPAESGSIGEETWIRFPLYYYARVLYELARSGCSVTYLRSQMERIAAGPLERDGDLFTLAKARGSVTHAVSDPVGDLQVALRRAGIRDFEVEGDFRIGGRALAVSVIAVLQAILPRLSPDAAGAMFAALANMNVSYTLTHRCRDPKSLREVPAIAYRAAAFV